MECFRGIKRPEGYTILVRNICRRADNIKFILDTGASRTVLSYDILSMMLNQEDSSRLLGLMKASDKKKLPFNTVGSEGVTGYLFCAHDISLKGGSFMSKEMYSVVDGIKYYDEPTHMNSVEFMESNPGCNCVIEDGDSALNIVVICNAVSPEYNEKLHEIFKKKYLASGKYLILHGTTCKESDLLGLF